MRIFLAEDNPGDVLLVREALQLALFDFDLVVRRDGEQAILYWLEVERGDQTRPDIVLLDLNLPRRDGSEILARIRGGERHADVPVLIVTSSDAPQDRETTARLGANGYFRKPSQYDEFLKLGDLVKKLAAGA